MNDASTNAERSYAWIGILATFCTFAIVAKMSFYTPDSWSYLELSNTVFSDFYKVNTVRQYLADIDYSCAFPPLWPVLIAAFRKVWDIGIYTGTLINLGVCIALLAGLIKLARRLELPAWIGTATYLGIMACTAFLEDALAARNSALTLLFLTLTAQSLVRETLRLRDAVLAGLWMGMACMNRFDAMPAAALCGLIVAGRSERSGFGALHKLKLTLTFYLVLLVVLSPWIVYSKLRFDTWWITDNARQVFLSSNVFVMNYYATPPERELFTQPMAWLKGLLTNKIPMAWKGMVFTLVHSATLALLGALLIVRAGLPNPAISPPRWRFLVVGGLLAAAFVIAPTLVGYGDERYFLPVQWFILLALFAKLLALTPNAWSRGRVVALLFVMTIAVVPSHGISWLVKNRSKLLHSGWFAAPRQATPEMQRVANAIERDAAGQWSRLLMYSPYGEGDIPATFFMPDGSSTTATTHVETNGGWNEWQYGALTGQRVAVMPRIISGSFASYLRDWRITHLYDGLQVRATEFRNGAFFDDEHTTVKLIPLNVPGLYRIELRPKEK